MLNLPSVRSLLFALAVLSIVVLGMPTTSSAQIAFSVSFGPPALPVYEQPYCPGEGFLWTPGYWAYDYDFGDYYWVPGTWVRAPRVGYYWTPGYWAYSGNRYVFYDGYWGPQIGFYGGINYGYGYFGNGYDGGRWERGRFFYNRSVSNVNVTVIHNVYNTTVINRTNNRVSFNGGNGGISARPTRQQETFARQRHLAPVSVQTEHRRAARVDPEQRASVNHGRPAIAASPRPGDFKNRVPAKEAGGTYNPPAHRAPSDQRGNRRDTQSRETNQQANRPGQRPANKQQADRPAQRPDNQQRVQDERRQKNDRPPSALAPKEIPRGQRPAPVTGDPARNQPNQRDQQKANQRQEQERQRVQQNQQQQNQRMEQQRANESRKQQAEQQHQQQQQNQRVEQKREQQQQRAEPRREPPPQAQPRREPPPQAQPKREPPNRDESKPKKDRPPNQR